MTPGRVGNGSLMRVLPAATLPDTFGIGRDAAIHTATEQSSVTHPQPLAKVSCALYVELCWALAEHPGGLLSRLVDRAEEALRGRGILGTPDLHSLGC
jgi:ADP-ribosylglycohydrolase